MGSLSFLQPREEAARGNNPLLAGGAELQMALLARALRSQGHDVSLVVPDYGQPDGQIIEGIVTRKAFPPNAGLPVLRFLHPRLSGLWAALRRANADVYVATAAGMQLGVITAFCRRYHRRSVFRVANDADCDPSRLLIRFRRDRWLYQRGLRQVDAILAQNDRQVADLQRHYGRQATLIGQLMDTTGEPASYTGAARDVLWVSNLRPYKCPERVFEVASLLPEASFAVVGGEAPGCSDLYRDVRDRAMRSDNVAFIGAVPYHEIGAYFSTSRVLINTSDAEGFPNTFLQAWCRGLPVVTYHDPGDVVRNRGLGAAVTSSREMASAVRALLDDEETWRATSQRCLEHFATTYRSGNALAPYLEAMESKR